MEPDFLTWVKRAQALSATGVHFAASDFDRERYEELVVLTHRMLARLGDVPLSSVNGLFNDIGQGYATPKVDVRGVAVDPIIQHLHSGKVWRVTDPRPGFESGGHGKPVYRSRRSFFT